MDNLKKEWGMLKFRTQACTVVMAAVFLLCTVQAGQIPIANHSFEIPSIDPNDFPAIPVAPFWIELDVDKDNSLNTGVFRNPPPQSAYDHIINADANQLAFLGSQSGNGFLQNLSAVYQNGKSYKLMVDVCPSVRYPPYGPDPNNKLVLSLYYLNDANTVDVETSDVPSTDLVMNVLKTYSVTLSDVETTDPWAGQNIGISIRAMGLPGGYWDLDNVRLIEFQSKPDFTGDSFVNLLDLAAMASQWRSCTEVTTDLTGDGCVDTEDLLLLAMKWLDYV